ncbi:MAG: hypothetical protein KH972_02515 [Peptostreptococcaceae bacterium]|nr:hypothetical protein [Peptostreptococcaceae bacterium]
MENLTPEERKLILQHRKEQKKREEEKLKVKERRFVEFSKAMVFITLFIGILILLIAAVLNVKVKDTENMTKLAIAAIVLITSTVGFYLWKAKNENISKGKLEIEEVKADSYAYCTETLNNLSNNKGED